jgi:hypothetical protein
LVIYDENGDYSYTEITKVMNNNQQQPFYLFGEIRVHSLAGYRCQGDEELV